MLKQEAGRPTLEVVRSDKWESKNGRWTLELVDSRKPGSKMIKATDNRTGLTDFGTIGYDGWVYWDHEKPKYVQEQARRMAARYLRRQLLRALVSAPRW